MRTLLPKSQARKKVPEELAVIYADHCTGCGACIEVCPVDCIAKVNPYTDMPGLQAFCEIDWDRCIGCKLCIRLPRRKSDPYILEVCPWHAIEMVPAGRLAEEVDRIAGPPDWAEANHGRLLAAARRQAEQLSRR
jgi:electron transport complex protein RnfB